MKKAVSIFLTAVMLLTFTAPISAQTETSDISGHWAEKQLNKWIENGILQGYGDGTVRPDNNINRAEFVSLLNRVFKFVNKSDNIFIDIPDRAWYADDVHKAVHAGIIVGDGKGHFNPSEPVSRQQAAVALSKAFLLEADASDSVSKFKDSAGIAPWSKEALNALVGNGYMAEKTGNRIAPADNLTRAEFVVLLDNIAGDLKNSAGTYTGYIDRNLVVNTKDVVLSNMTINGDLFLTEGIGEGEITLDNVSVKGRTVVKGGGENSIVVNNSSLEGTLLILKVNGKIRIVASGSTAIPFVKLGSGALLQEADLEGKGFDTIELLQSVEPGQEILLDGDFGSVFVNAPGVKVNVTEGTVGTLVIGKDAAGSAVAIADNASVGTLTANSGVSVTGKGQIETANINARDVTIDQTPSKVNVSEGFTAKVGGKTVTNKTSGSGSDTGNNSNPPTAVKIPDRLNSGLSSYNSANLKWARVEGVDSYNVYRSESLNGIYTKINANAITALGYTDAGLDAAKTYYYKVTAVKGGRESPKSEASFVTTPAEVEQGDWKLAWSDEFNGVPGTGADTENWVYEVSGSGFGNGELQYTTDRTENVFIKEDPENPHNGLLAIKAIKEEYNGKQYTSGRIKTDGKFDFTYGKAEMRAKLPYGKGIGCSFWMLGSNHNEVGWPACGEIDILEWVGKPVSKIYGTIHGPGYSAGDSIGAWHEYMDGFSEEFHTYSVEWEPGVIRWYFDGKPYAQRTPADLFGKDWVFDHDFYMILGLGVGGTWPGSPDESTLFPQEYTIDYIRVYQREGGVYPEAPYRNFVQLKNSGTGQFVCTDKQNEDYLYANRNSSGAWETFELTSLDGDAIALRSLTNYKYVSVAADNKLIANKETIGDTETFVLETNSDGTKSLKSAANEKYVLAAAGSILAASSSSVASFEKFTLYCTPETPTGLAVSAVTNSSATLGWDAIGNAAGYNVYRSEVSNGFYTKMNDLAIIGNEYTDMTVTPGITYYYKVTAFNGLGESDYSTFTTAAIPEEPTPPAAPINLSAEYGTSDTIGIGWHSVAGAESYNVYRSDASNGEYIKVNTSEVAGTSFTDIGLTEGNAYYYKVTAVNDIGESLKSGVLFATTFGYGIDGAKSYAYIISAANSKFIEADSTDHMIPLKAAANDASTDNQLFEIVYGVSGYVGLASKSLDKIACTDSWNTPDYQIIPRTNYSADPSGWEAFTIVPQGDGTVAIKAENGGKYVSVSPSDSILRATSTAIGVKEKFIIVTPGKSEPPSGLNAAEVLDTSITLKWAAPASSFFTGYDVYRATAIDGQYIKLNDELLTVTTYTDTGVKANNTYYYKVAAVNFRGSASSTAVSAQTLGGPLPAIPTGLDMTYTEGTVSLSWTNAADADSYNVYRSTSRFGTYEKLNSEPVTDEAFVDVVLNNSFYYYRVTAVNKNGESKRSAPVSSELELFGPNVYIFDPNDSAAEIQNIASDVYEQMKSSDTAQFTSGRYALLFKPGVYTTDVKVGYYTHVAGLGKLPTDTTIHSLTSEPALPDDNSTCNFWRSAENMTIDSNTLWAVSQAVSLRRMKINGELALFKAAGWASGGYLADSLVTGTANSGGQQQWFSRNSDWSQWSGGVWNMVFVGIAEGKAPAGTWPETKNTTVEETPVIREKPFLYIDGDNSYKVFVPALKENSKGISWGSGMGVGTSISIDSFHIARPEIDTADTINAALNKGKHLLLTPGIYNLDKAIEVNNANTVIFGLGLATLTPTNANACMKIADVDGVVVAGVLFDAGEDKSEVLLEVGPESSSLDHSVNPTVLSDLYFRVGGRNEYTGKADVCIIINSNNVVGDNFWVWRADHGYDIQWHTNITKNGIVVNGDDVTMYALMVEHFHEYQTVWNGNGGRTYFYQSEIPYDVPNQESWMSHDGTKNGYASYKVADHVTSHEAWGLGIYSFHRDATIDLHSAIEVPDAPGVRIHNACTVMLAGYPGISHVVNNEGGAVTIAGQRQEVIEYCNVGAKVRTPIVLPQGGTFFSAKQVTIQCATLDAAIRYTTDGTIPTEASAEYAGPITIDGYTVLNVIAFKEGLESSELVTATYSIDTSALERNLVDNGFFDSGTEGWEFWSAEEVNGVISIEDGKAKIYHSTSDGEANWNTMLTQSGIGLESDKTYVLSFDISGNTAKEIDVCVEKASDSGLKYLNKRITLSSEMTTYSYEFTSDSEPVNAKLAFLLGGSGTAGDTIFIDNVALWEKDMSAPNQVKTPSFNISSGIFNSAQTISISCATEGASIRYTIDGTEPAIDYGTLYAGTFQVSEDATIKAIAYKEGMDDSAVSSITIRFTDNYALNRPSTASSGTAGHAFDGDTGTRWESDHSDPQWIRVDLGKECAVTGVKIVWEGAAGKEYKIQVSADDESWTDVYAVTDGVGGATLDAGFPAATGRYVRMYGTTRVTEWGYSIFEFEVYANKTAAPAITVEDGDSGKIVSMTGATSEDAIRYTLDGSTPTAVHGTVYDGPFSVSQTTTVKAIAYRPGMTSSNIVSKIVRLNDNIALNKSSTASSENRAAELAFDGNTGTCWESVHDADPQWIQVDLGATYDIRKIIIIWENASAADYTIEVSDDGENWTPIIGKENMPSGHIMDETLVEPVTGQYVRMYGTERAIGYGYSIFEFEVYGSPTE